MGDWGFALPMASAVLAVCWPDRFTIYDYRVCEQLKAFKRLGHLTRAESVWKGYRRFCSAVIKKSPKGWTLRDCDRHLWGKSAAKQLKRDIAAGFPDK